MLSIGKLGAGQERYYTDKVARGAEDYYSGEGEAEGRWLGEAAHDLGLHEAVGADQLTAMLSGLDPASGEPLGLRAVGGRGAVPGFDLTFSVPKSVSLLWALGEGETAAEIREAVDRSLEASLSYLQGEACLTRRGGGAEFVKGRGFLVAAFPHRTSRAGDPQLHVHALIANATQGPDGKWTRLYHPAIYEHAKTAGYLFEAHLRCELTCRLGIRWQGVRNGIAEIEGFSDAHLREFSTRRQQILEATGPDASARSRQVATLATRGAKTEIDGASLRQRWHEKAVEIGLIGEVIAQRTGPARSQPEPTRIAVAEIGGEVTAHASHFDRREVIQAVAGLLPSGAPAHEVEAAADAFLTSAEVVRIAEASGAKGERFTTRRIWELERRALASAGEMAERRDRALAGERIAANVLSLHPTLKTDQREMVSRLLTAGEGLAVVIGEAGTGKTYATLAAAEGWAAAGVGLRVAAPTWRAANVLRSEGLEATSIARLLAQLDRAEAQGSGGLAEGSVLLVDEAGMVDSASLARLIAHTEAAGAKLVVIGDPEQLPEIEAGGLFRALCERTRPIHLSEVIRHRHQTDREGTKLIRMGEGRAALALYESEERVVVSADAEARREAMVAAWSESLGRGEDAVMVAKRNAEVACLNERAREAMRGAGRLGEVEIVVGEAGFAVGDRVITRVNDQRLAVYNRERWEVAEVDVANGGVVLHGVDQERAVSLDAAYLSHTNREAPALQHAYAITTYSAQGSTFDRAFIAADPSMDKQELYVAASRARGETHIYATPEVRAEGQEFAPRSTYLREGIPHIAEAAERDRAQVAAHDLAELRALPSEELSRLCRELRPHAKAEGKQASAVRWTREQIEKIEATLARLGRDRARAEERPRRERREEWPPASHTERNWRARLAEEKAKLRALGDPPYIASPQLRTVEAVLAEREAAVLHAAKLRTPAYVVSELGERPAHHRKAAAWDKGVEEIERYRREHGVRDPAWAIGPEPSREQGAEWIAHRNARLRLQDRQVQLGRARERALGREIRRSFGRGR